jgi:large subunit ribosomal protein L15
MPLQRRLPKRGFKSPMAKDYAEIRLHELARIEPDPIDLAALKQAGIVNRSVNRAKVIASGSLDKAVHLRGIAVTPGARAVIEQAGGSIES